MFIARRSKIIPAPLGAECHMALLWSAAAFFYSGAIDILLLWSSDRFLFWNGQMGSRTQ